ncbi:hypothetical protein BJ138DRAFT_1126231 [Hygrophoropsis aurantiaca]|uniref:Uncharacterized protein n=1 Tax=Hygrophoropsis aurantiaca TaxID=72124 RepID=A0ACB8ACT3_9AGAM|nr:hypothetical protein BJ138DRAFT_1126231 [Hygrophoropsis aurantiaca]
MFSLQVRPSVRAASARPWVTLVQRSPRILSSNYSQQFQPHSYPVVTSLPKTCPSCGALLPTLLPVCPACNYIARVHSSISFHEYFGLPYDPNPFILDTSLLRRRFLDSQKVSHPDAWATKDNDLRDAALDVSNAVNTAYKTLLTPLSRVEYILQRQGIETGEADQLEDLDLISEIMEVREEIDNIQADYIGRLHSLESENNIKIHNTLKIIEDLVAKREWDGVRTAAIRLKYLQGITNAIKSRLEFLDNA